MIVSEVSLITRPLFSEFNNHNNKVSKIHKVHP